MVQLLIKIKVIVVGLLMFILAQSSVAQPEYIQLNQFTTDHGLSASGIIDITQDKHGFIWLATTDGINRFDGNSFKVYKKNSPGVQRGSLPDNFIISLCFDSQNRLMVGTNAGLSLYRQSFDGFHNFIQDSSSCLFDQTIQVRCIESPGNGDIIMGTRKGILIYNPDNNTLKTIKHDPSDIHSLYSNTINDLLLLPDGKLWVATPLGVNVIELDNLQVDRVGHQNAESSPTELNCNKLIFDHNNTIWVGTENKGLFYISAKQKGAEHLQAIGSELNDLLRNKRIMALAADKENKIWIGVENNGVYCYHPEKQILKNYLSGKSDPFTTKTYSVESLFFDVTGNLWLGTHGNGIGIAAPNSDAIVTYHNFKGGDLSNTNNMVNAFCQVSKNKIWVGTDGGGINVLNKETGLFNSYNTSNSDIPSDYILSIAKTNDNKIWLSTWGSGLISYDLKTKSFTNYTSSNSGLRDDNIFNISTGYNNDILIATIGTGVSHFQPDKNKWQTFNTDNCNINDNFVNVIRKDNKGGFYIGTRSGMMHFDLDKQEFVNCVLTDSVETLSKKHVYDIYVEKPHSIWVATLSGLNHYNPINKRNKVYTTVDGLPSNVVRGVLQDAKGSLWFLTNAGACQFDRLNKKFTNYSKLDGLQGNEFRPRSYLIDNKDKLYLGGMNGFTIIDPARLGQNKNAPSVKFTGLDINNEPVLPGHEGSPLKTVLSQTKEIKLRHDQTVLTFHFNTMDYVRPQKNQHAYLLENFDKDWTYCGTRRQATYTNLDPGKYIFHVKGANNDGVWNETGTALHITIIPPWWESWWFKSLLFLFVAGSIGGIYFLRIYNLQRQKEKLEQAVQNRTKELAEINATKDKLFSVIAHDLRNPFNVILGYTDVLANGYDTIDKKDYIDILNNLKIAGENAFNLLQNLLLWSKTQRNAIKFNPEESNLLNLIEIFLHDVNVFAFKKGIKISHEEVGRTCSVYADSNMFSLILRNLLTNAIKYSHPKGKIRISCTCQSNGYQNIGIHDEGIGIDAEKVQSLFLPGKVDSIQGTSGEKGSGLGLILCKEFVDLHKGNIWVESEPQKGSTFWFSLPATKNDFEK